MGNYTWRIEDSFNVSSSTIEAISDKFNTPSATLLSHSFTSCFEKIQNDLDPLLHPEFPRKADVSSTQPSTPLSPTHSEFSTVGSIFKSGQYANQIDSYDLQRLGNYMLYTLVNTN